MKKYILWLFLIIIIIIASGWIYIRETEKVPTPTPTDKVLTLKLGQSDSAFGLTITPTKVTQDSRCPVDVQCIQAGTVQVQTSITGGMGASTMTLTLGKSITTEGEEITLTDVKPTKISKQTIASSDYVFTFEVKKQ